MIRCRVSLRTLVVFLLACAAIFGQEVAQISGTARDQTGAVIPGVEITATQTDTGQKRTTMTDEGGNYVLSNLPLGPYRLEAAKEGFRTYVQTGIVLQVGSAPVVGVAMGVGQVTESVEVEANAAQVETRSVAVGSVMESRRILELPLNGRQATDLITLNGASVVTAVGPGVAAKTGVRVSVAGGHDYSVQYNLDGATHLETYSGSGMPLPFPEALQEFKLSTSTQDTSSNGHAGASVNAVTKSGTNNFHGSAFWFLRNAAINGRDFFSANNDALKRNQFGAVLGGPIKKDKIFFFLGYQGTRIRQTPTPSLAYVPTAKMLAGDFSDYMANSCLGPGRSFNPGVLDSNNHLLLPMSQAALNMSKDLPKTADPCGQTYTSNPLSQNDYQIPARLDYQLSEKQSLFARYVINYSNVKVPHEIDPANILNTGGVGADDMVQTFALGDTYVLGPTLVNSARVFMGRVGSLHPYAANWDPATVGVRNFYTYRPNLMSVLVAGGGGGFSVGIPANFFHTDTGYTNFGFNEDMNWVKGSHQISFGANAFRTVLVGNNYAWSEGFLAMIGIPAPISTGGGLGDFLTGKVNNLHQGNPNPNWTRQNFFGLYIGDTWKATSRLTVNLGLRWNPFLPIQFTQSDTTNFSLAGFYSGVTSQVIHNAIPGFKYPGDPGFNGRSGMNSQMTNFEPRIGLAYDPFGDGKTSIRIGAGIAYDFIMQGVHMNTSTVNPFRTTVILNNVSLDNPYANVPGGNPYPYQYDPKNPQFQYFPKGQGFYLMPPDLKTTQAYQWNLGIQRQITPALFASATYIGSHLIHVWTGVDLNPGQYIPGNCVAGQYGLTAAGPCSTGGNVDARRLLQLKNPSAAQGVLGSMVQMDSGATQSYNGLLLNATWRKGNVNIIGNYTWSHCIGMPYTSVANLGAAAQHGPYQNNGPVDRRLDMGDCVLGTLDQRHIANITAVINTGQGAGNSFTRRLTSNWSVSTIYTARSGWATNPQLSNDQALSGLFSTGGGYQIPQRPNQVLADTSISTKGQSCARANCVQWFNGAAFANPAAGTLGGVNFGIMRAPGFWEWDQALVREFNVREGQTLQFRAEAFNLTNSVRYYIAPQADAGMTFAGPNFGNIVSAASTTGSSSLSGSGGRVMQFALKYVF